MSNLAAIIGVLATSAFTGIDLVSAIFVFGALVIVWNLIIGELFR